MELSSIASNPLMSSQNRDSGSTQGRPNVATEAQASVQRPHPRPSDNIGWDWAIYPEWPKKNKIKCTLCGHETTGGISRQKEHLTGSRGNTKPCKKVTPDIIARVKAAMAEIKGKKLDKIRFEIERRQDVDISNSRIENAEEITKIGNKTPREFGAIHRYATFLPEEPTSSSTMKQTTVDAAERKRRKELVHEWVSLWTYESGIPFHALMLPSFNNMCEAIGQFGPGYVGPTMYQLRETLLKKAVSRTSVGLEPHKKLWETTGCTLMTDSWTDQKHRCVMNMCIRSSAGVIFYNSIEESAESHTRDFIYKWVDQCIQEIGADYVVQVITDNHSANMAAKEKLKSERPRIFWTSCAAHTTNLMLQDIGKLTKFKNIIEKAGALTIFIYGHTRTLALMRKCTRRKDIVRPGTTRFATSFLTLGSLLEKKDALMAMFNSDEFTSLKFVGAAKKKALTANATVISRTFRRGVRSCLKVFTPLFKFLRMVDSDTCPSMRFIIGELKIVKREIMIALKTEKDYMPIISIIERHAKNRLDSSLHLAAWFLNPLFFYAEDEEAKKSAEAKQAVLDCAELFFRNEDTIDEAVVDAIYSTELLKYRDCDAFIHGKPRAQRVVKRIAEDRNPDPHKEKNRLDSKRLSDLVYVQFNLRIRTKMDTTRKDGKKRDILLAKDGRHASAWVVDGYNSEEEEDYYPGTDIPLGVISEAAGTDEFLQVRRTTRRANMASSSRANEELDSEDEEEGRNDDSDSDEEDIQLDDDDGDEDALRDEILLLGTAADDDDYE